MSNIYLDAADSVRRAAKQHEIYVKAAEALDRVGSLVQAAAEAEKAIVQTTAERDRLLQEVEDVKAEKAKIKQSLTKMVDESKSKADDTIATAIARAKEEAERVAKNAAEIATAVEAAAQLRLQELSAAAAKWQEEVAKAMAEHATITREIEDKQDKVTTLENSLARLRAKLG